MSLQNTIKELSIAQSESLLGALKKMDAIERKLLIVIDDNQQFKTLVSIGDIQRAIIRGIDLSEKLSDVEIEAKFFMYEPTTLSEVQSTILELRCEFMPILNNRNEIISIYFWDDLFMNKEIQDNHKMSVPVIIMAGGKGTRLKPISNVLPKPLTPIGESTIVEEIMDRFSAYGCSKFFISVNYKKELLQYYLDKNASNRSITYVSEEIPLGTAGGLSLLKGKISETFFVTNCDILVNQDLSEIYEYHRENKNDITMVAALKHIPIPYGTLETKENGLLDSMKEKPEITLKINAGLYILEPDLLDEIPEGTFFHITELIEGVRENGGRVGVFPVSEKSWFDIGEWPEYINTVRALSSSVNFKGL